MFVIGVAAQIGGAAFNRIHAVEVKNSIKVLGKTAKLELPTTARLERAGELVGETESVKVFNVGDEVVINFGYDGDLREEFRGFVRLIKPTNPLEIYCEDAVYLLKRKRMQKSFRNITLASLLDYILQDTGIEIVNEIPVINFRTFMLKNVNAAQVLEKLRKSYGLTIYFSAFKQLVVGLASYTDDVLVKYVTGENVIGHDLEWQSEDDVSLRIKAVSISQDNQFTTKVVGDEDGEERTVFFYNLDAGEDLEQRARQELLRFRRSGYKGSLRAFLLPYCEVGNRLRFTDQNYENQEGDYLVESVTTTVNLGGGTRKVTLGIKLD
jgi:hypothetical protein